MAMSNRKSPEADLQKACVEWYRWQYPRHLIWSVPNEGAYKNRALQRMGVVVGMPDLHMAWSGNFGVIELKAPGECPTKGQYALLEHFSGMGHFADWCSSFSDFQRTVRGWHG